MKILQFINQLGNGGAEKFCVELSNEIARHHEVVLCCATKIMPGMIHPRKLSGAVKLVQLDFKKKSLRGFYQIFRTLRTEKPDIVHIHSSLLFYYFTFLVILFKKVGFIHTIHSTITLGYQKLFDVLIKTKLFSKNIHHVCISSANRKEYQSKYPSLHFFQINNGIAPMATTSQLEAVQKEIEKFKKDRNYLFIAIGNYSNFKNFTMLVEVIKGLNLKGFKVSMIILGEDKSKGRKQWNLVNKLKDEHTHQLGLRSNVADYLYCSDALIMSSSQEGEPLVVLEAMAVGRPVISTPAGGVVDKIQPGINGFLARGFKPEDLEREIIAFIKSTPPAESIMPNEKKIVFPSQYSMQKCAGEYLDLYRTVLND